MVCEGEDVGVENWLGMSAVKRLLRIGERTAPRETPALILLIEEMVVCIFT